MGNRDNINITFSRRQLRIVLGVLAVVLVTTFGVYYNRHIIGNRYYSKHVEELDFEVVELQDFKDEHEDILQWYSDNYKRRGVYDINTSKKGKYILISAGERRGGLQYEFNYTSVLGFEDKINVHTYLEEKEGEPGNDSEVSYPHILLRLSNNDPRQVITPMLNLMAGDEGGTAIGIRDLPREEITSGGIFEGVRLSNMEMVLQEGDITYNQKIKVQDDGSIIELKNDFSKNDIVSVDYIFENGERTFVGIEKIDKLVIQGRLGGLKEDAVEILIEGYPRTFDVDNNKVMGKFKGMEEGEYCEITVINKDKPELDTERNRVVVIDAIKL